MSLVPPAAVEHRHGHEHGRCFLLRAQGSALLTPVFNRDRLFAGRITLNLVHHWSSGRLDVLVQNS